MRSPYILNQIVYDTPYKLYASECIEEKILKNFNINTNFIFRFFQKVNMPLENLSCMINIHDHTII